MASHSGAGHERSNSNVRPHGIDAEVRMTEVRGTAASRNAARSERLASGIPVSIGAGMHAVRVALDGDQGLACKPAASTKDATSAGV